MQAGLGNARGHAVRDQVRRNRSNGVLGGRSSTKESRGSGLRREDGRRVDLVDARLGDDAVASAHLGWQNLLESSLLCDLFNAFKVL